MHTITKTLGIAALSAGLLAGTAGIAASQQLTMWARDSGAILTQRIIDRWNEQNPDTPIELTIIPATEMVTKFATAASTGEVPDLLSLDLIFAPPFMRAGFFDDLTDELSGNEDFPLTVGAHQTLVTWEDRYYGVPFTPDTSILIYNKDLFEQAGLDPDSPPTSSAQILEYARAISALGEDTHGFYFSGACGGCNIFTMAPQMWASEGTVVLPDQCGTEPLQGDSIAAVLNHYRTMWEEGLIPESAEVDGGASFIAAFGSGNVGMMGTGNFAIGTVPDLAPGLNFGVALLPGGTEGEVSSFAGGDILAVPARGGNKEVALEFVNWVISDDPQIEVYAATTNMPARLDIAEEHFATTPELATTVEALSVAQTPYTMRFFELSNDPTGPWLEMIQGAVFDGDVEGAIEFAKSRMNDIICD